MEKEKFDVLLRDAIGNILVNKKGYVTCICEGLQFQVLYKEIDFSCDTLECIVNNSSIFIQLHETIDTTSKNDKNISSPVMQFNETIDTTSRNDDNIILSPVTQLHETNIGTISRNDTNTLPSSVTQSENNMIIQEEHLEDDTFVWSDASIKLFLSIYKEKLELWTNCKIKTRKMWEKIRTNMQSKGYNITTIQIENKYKSLERSFKNMIANNKKTGRGRVCTTCPYQSELTELLGSKHNIEPLAVSDREGLIVREDVRASTSLCSSDTQIMKIQIPLSPNMQKGNNTTEIRMRNTAIGTRDIEIGNNSSKILQDQMQRKRKGNTARIVEKCQESIEKFVNDIAQEKESKLEIQRQILSEYKQLRVSYEESFKKIQEQLEIANKLKEEKNILLKELIYANRNQKT